MGQPSDQMGQMESAPAVQPRLIFPRVESAPDILSGKPVIAGTRLSVEIVLDNLASGDTFEDLLDAYPFLTRDDISAAIKFAAHLAAQPPSSLREQERAAS